MPLKWAGHSLNSLHSFRRFEREPALALRPQNPQSRSEQLAERDSAQQDVFLREVDDALRQDEMLGAFKRYGRPIGIAVGAGLLALAGYLWWNDSRQAAAGERGEQLTLALDKLDSGNRTEADKQLAALAGKADDGTAAAAKMTRAGIALAENRKADALKLFAEVSADGDAPQPFRDLATIRAVAADFDALPAEQVVARLKPLAIPGNAWFGSAGELLGMAYLKQGKNSLAGPLFAAIAKDKNSPASLRDRARSLAGLLGVDAVDDPEKAAAASQ